MKRIIIRVKCPPRKRFLCSAPGDYHPDPEIFVKECNPNIWSNEWLHS